MEAVRPATAEDESRLRELAGDLLAGLTSQRGGALLFDSDPRASDGTGVADRIVDGVEDVDRLVLVGTLDDMVVAFACGHLADRDDRTRRGVLDACYVEPEARGVGIGHLLMDVAVTWLENHGAADVDGTALPGDRQAKNFFESAGFKARMLTMHRSLG